jgi:hypothetical protein
MHWQSGFGNKILHFLHLFLEAREGTSTLWYTSTEIFLVCKVMWPHRPGTVLALPVQHLASSLPINFQNFRSHCMQLRHVESLSSPDKCPLEAAATSISVAYPDKQHLWRPCHQKRMDNILNFPTTHNKILTHCPVAGEPQLSGEI